MKRGGIFTGGMNGLGVVPMGADETTAAPVTITETVVEGDPNAPILEPLPPPDANGGMAQAGIYGGTRSAFWDWASFIGAGVGVYHGYKRNEKIGWALLWGFFGALTPIITIPVALAQGFGKRKGR